MKKKYLLFIVLFFVIITSILGFKKVKAIDYYDVTVLNSDFFEELPDEINVNNSLQLTYGTFGTVNNLFFYSISSGSTAYGVLYISNNFIDPLSSPEVSDDQYFSVSDGLFHYVNSIWYYLNSIGKATNHFKVFVNFNYYDAVTYVDDLENIYTGISGYEECDNYVLHFGGYNSMYFQYKFLNNINSYYNNILSTSLNYDQGFYDGQVAQMEADDLSISALEDTIAQKNELINELYGELNDPSNTDFANFTALLGQISMFPIKFFKEGLDVEIWGINIGHLVLGFFMLSISLTVIGFIGTILGRATKGGKS